MSENKAGVRELKTHLSAYLRDVKEGQTVVITEHGEPVAQIIPTEKSLEKKMKNLVDSGIISWDGERFEPGEPVARNSGDETVADLVSEQRESEGVPASEQTDS